MKTQLRHIGETKAIQRWIKLLPSRPDVLIGPGDDAAVVKLPGGPFDLVLKSDPVIEHVHFTSSDIPELIGHKAAGRVLSDMAAMGASPCWLLVNTSAPPRTPVARIDGVLRGLCRLASRFGAAVVGGDLSSGPVLAVNVFAAGLVPHRRPLTRAGARPGDLILVTGRLGASLSSGRHLKFTPRIHEGLFLRDWATSAIDISDGLATDLRHIIDASRVGARISAANIPVSPSAKDAHGGRSPLEHALCDGEDFELLFTIPCNRERAFTKAWKKRFRTPCTCIGRITPERGAIDYLDRNGRTIRVAGGFEHFLRRSRR